MRGEALSPNPMWYFWNWYLADSTRLSRVWAVASALFGVVIFVYGLFAPEPIWIATALAVFFFALAFGIWKLGDWWKLRQAIRKAQVGMPEQRRGFAVIEQAPDQSEK